MCEFNIQELNLANYRRFENETFTLNPRMNVFAGKNGSGKTTVLEAEYSCAMKSHFRKFGNQMSGSGNHLCNYASLLA